jgi:hypothetical protein
MKKKPADSSAAAWLALAENELHQSKPLDSPPPGAVTAAELSQIWSMSGSSVRLALMRLKKEGRVDALRCRVSINGINRVIPFYIIKK